MKIDKAVKMLMLKNDVSAHEMAKRTGFNRSTIFRTVGAGSNPKINSLKPYADALNVKVSDIILLAESLDGDFLNEADFLKMAKQIKETEKC